MRKRFEDLEEYLKKQEMKLVQKKEFDQNKGVVTN